MQKITKIQQIRTSLALTQKEFGRRLHMSESGISRYESDHQVPRAQFLAHLARFIKNNTPPLKITIEEVLDDYFRRW